MTTTLIRILVASLIVVALILAWAAIQGIGESFGGGLREYLAQ